MKRNTIILGALLSAAAATAAPEYVNIATPNTSLILMTDSAAAPALLYYGPAVADPVQAQGLDRGDLVLEAGDGGAGLGDFQLHIHATSLTQDLFYGFTAKSSYFFRGF